MTSFWETKYPNNIRQVSGTPTLYRDDVVLLCDTKAGAVTINLFDIPDNFWNTTWRLYIIDEADFASVNPIKINAGAGQFINSAADVTINTDGGVAMVQIVSNTDFIATLSTTGGATIDGHVIQDETLPLPQQPNLNFTGDLVQATNNAPNNATDVTISFPDTGWLDLQGFGWMTPTLRPQYRIIGKSIKFRRNLVVPIENAGVIIPYNSASDYDSSTIIVPATIDAEGVILNSGGSFTFNKGNPVLQNPAHYPDATYTSEWLVAFQRRHSQAPVGSDYSAYYTTVFRISLTTSGTLVVQCLKDAEIDAATQQYGQSALRYLVSSSIAGDRVLDYRNITDSAAGAATIVGRSNVGTPNDAINVGLNTDNANHNITHDPAEETDVGGYKIPTNNYNAYIV